MEYYEIHWGNIEANIDILKLSNLTYLTEVVDKNKTLNRSSNPLNSFTFFFSQ